MAREIGRRQERNRLPCYRPSPKQAEFHAAGAAHRERLLAGEGQTGKSLAAAMEWAMHLTGRYPDWWQGRRFERSVRLWAAAADSDAMGRGTQRLLLGEGSGRDQWGTGAIPGAAINWKRSRMVPGLPDRMSRLFVRHGCGYTSVLRFVCWDEGVLPDEAADGVWFDEEPPAEVYERVLAATEARDGMVVVTGAAEERVCVEIGQ